MRNRRLVGILACLVLLALTPMGALAQLYRLESGTSRQEGCLPPCLCPIQWNDDVVGTFEIFQAGSDFCFTYYKVKNVNWVFSRGGVDVRVTGEGEYQVGGCMRPRQHRLKLSLTEDSGAAVEYDSGLVAGGGEFPAIVISIARNGFFCFDTVYDLVAKPVSDKDLTEYFLHHTEYLEGCYAPCRCLLQSWAAYGGFYLVDINTSPNPARKRYALIKFTATTLGPIDPPDRSWGGFGIYSVGRGDHRLVVDLHDPTVGAQRFDSGLTPYDGAWPEINIDISTNGFYCFNYAFYLHARPN